MEISLQEKKLEIIQWLVSLEDSELLNKIFTLKPQQKDWWDEISDAEKHSIERGLKDIENGRVTPHEDVMEKYEGRF